MERVVHAGMGGGSASGALPPSVGLLSDLRLYLRNRPLTPTLIECASPAQRKDYAQRILERLGVSVSAYAVLNLHRIAVDAPIRFVFDELQRAEVAAGCWPNHLAELERVDGGIDHLRVHLLGQRGAPFGLRYLLRAVGLVPLFQLDKLRFREVSGPLDLDDACFRLYACSGGYPIGICSVYTRPSVPAAGEAGQSQVFFLVSFDFYGRKGWLGSRIVAGAWEAVHNRVTSNMLNRFKQLCEARFRQVTRRATVGNSQAAAATLG